MIDRIDILVAAIIEWCDGKADPPIYTKDSIEDCALEITNCAINGMGKVISDDNELKKCSRKGQKLLIKIDNTFFSFSKDVQNRR